MEKKIIWIVNQYVTPTEIRTRQIVLSQLLEERGYEVYLICGSKVHGREENLIKDNRILQRVEYDGAHFIIIKIGNYSNSITRVFASLQFQFSIWKHRDQLPKPDVIVSNFAGLFGNMFLKWKRKYKTRLVFDILDLWPEFFIDMGFLRKNSLLAKLLYFMEYISYREADGILFSFEGGKEYIIEKKWNLESGGEVDLNKVGYLNNGTDLDTVDYQRRTFILNDPDLDTKLFKVAYLGSIRLANNVNLIVETAKVLKQMKEDSIIILVYGDGDFRTALEQKCTSLRLNNIKFKGRLPVKYAPNMLSRCNLNLFNFADIPVSRFGISPNKLFMYFSSSKPVLSTVRPAYDLVTLRKCGLVVENDSKSIADGILKFFQMDDSEYSLYCKNCRIVAEEFDYKNLVEVLIRKIED